MADEAREAWYVRFPPIYSVAIAVVAGDALGNSRIFIAFAFAIVLAALAAFLIAIRMRGAGVAIALMAIVAASTAPVRAILEPPRTLASVRLFPDGSLLTIEGSLV